MAESRRSPKNSFKSRLQHRSIVQAHQKDPSWKRRPTAKQSEFKQQRDTRNFVRQYMRNTSKAFFAFGYFFLPWHFTPNTHLLSWFLSCGRSTVAFLPEVQCPTHLWIDDLEYEGKIWKDQKDVSRESCALPFSHLPSSIWAAHRPMLGAWHQNAVLLDWAVLHVTDTACPSQHPRNAPPNRNQVATGPERRKTTCVQLSCAKYNDYSISC